MSVSVGYNVATVTAAPAAAVGSDHRNKKKSMANKMEERKRERER